MKTDVTMYDEIWNSLEKAVSLEAEKVHKAYRFHIHGLNAYFENKYGK